MYLNMDNGHLRGSFSKTSQTNDRFGDIGKIYCGVFGVFCQHTFVRNIYLEFGYEFGFQRVRDLANVRPYVRSPFI